MALVTVTYNAWDHNRQVVPADLKPEVWFRPLQSSLVNGMMTQREVKGSLDPVTGAGSVQLESGDGVIYVPEMRWLRDPSQEAESVENRARGRCEWDPINPGNGGPIHGLPGIVRLSAVWYGFGDPPEFLMNRDDSIYLDITGPGVGVWAPSSVKFAEGTVI